MITCQGKSLSLKCVRLTILSLYLLSMLGFICFSDAFQTEKFVVKGKLQSRAKREVEILAECDMDCKDEKDVEDYDVLLAYDYGDEEKSGSSSNGDSSCVHVCKIVSVNKTSEPGPSTVISVEEVTEKKAEASLSTAKTKNATPTTKDEEEVHSTTQSVMTSITSKDTEEVVGSTLKEETTTISGKSNFEMVPIIGNETQEDDESISNFLPRDFEARIERLPMDTPENFSEHLIDSMDETPTEEPPIRLVPKVIRLSVLETELEEAKPLDKPPLVFFPEYNSLLSLLNGSLSKILSEISAIKTKINPPIDAKVQNLNTERNSSNLFSDGEILSHEDRPALNDTLLADFKSLLLTPAEVVTTPNYTETTKPSLNPSSILLSTSNSVEISTNPITTAATIITTLKESSKPNISTQYVEPSSAMPTSHVENTEEESDPSTSTQNLSVYTEYTSSTVTVPVIAEEANVSAQGINETSITPEPFFEENDKDELKILGNISTTFSPLPYNMSYSSFDTSETTIIPTNFSTETSNSTMNQNETVASETSMENNTLIK